MEYLMKQVMDSCFLMLVETGWFLFSWSCCWTGNWRLCIILVCNPLTHPAFSARIRLPFYIVPGEFINCRTNSTFTFSEKVHLIAEMAVTTAVNGGFYSWHWHDISEDFKLFLLAQAAVYFYGRTKQRDALFAFNNNNQLIWLSYRSTQIEFPFLEYKPVRSFQTIKVQHF